MRPHRAALALALTFLGVHLTVTLLVRSSELLSNLLLVIPALCAAAACWHHSGRCRGPVRRKWQLLAIGIALWMLGQALYTYTSCLDRIPQTQALTADFYFFLWGVPVLLAIASAEDDADPLIFLVLDTIQAMLAVFLVYFQLFAPQSLSLSGASHAIGVKQLMYLYLGENLVLTGAATLRLLARPARDEQHFYRVLCLFLWVYTIISIPANAADVFLKSTSGTFVDAIWGIPFLVLLLTGFGSVRRRGGARKTEEPAKQTPAVLIIYNVCPALFTIAVLILAAHLSLGRFFFGTAAMALALLTYTLRASLLQSRYMRAQRALLESENALRSANGRLQEISLSDPLTGIANRRHFEQVLETEWNRAQRTGAPLSLLMIDVDHFKDINDRFGHLRGDQCLISVAQSLSSNLRRGGELLARYGGEEFVAILPNVDDDGAYTIAEEIRCSVSALSVQDDEHTSGCRQLTVSVGVCSLRPSPEYNAGNLVAAADAAMYRAKERGRNRTECLKDTDVFADLVPIFT